MYPDFEPLLKNPHITTIAANFWPRSLGSKTSSTRQAYRIDEHTTVVALENQPEGPGQAQLICVHGLEGSADAGYLKSLAAAALACGFGVHRLNLRTCGGTESLCRTMYHSGLTTDTWQVVRSVRDRFRQPTFLAGFSLGGNMVLKLAGEYECSGTLSGVCAISAPIDLAECVRAIDKPINYLYARRFLTRLKDRIRRKSAQDPGSYSSQHLDDIRSIWEFDDHYTAPLFGFGTAANYYATQSAAQFLPHIRVPGLIIAAEDDPLVPIEIYGSANIPANRNLELITPKHGGHLGFLSRTRPRFWLDGVVTRWMESRIRQDETVGTQPGRLTSV